MKAEDFQKVFEFLKYDELKIANKHIFDRHFDTPQEVIDKFIDNFNQGIPNWDYKKNEEKGWNLVFFSKKEDSLEEKHQKFDRVMRIIASDTINAECVVRKINHDFWSEKDNAEELIFDVRDYEGEGAEPIGWAVHDGKIEECYAILLAIELRGSNHKNRFLGYPFEIKSMYPITEEQF